MRSGRSALPGSAAGIPGRNAGLPHFPRRCGRTRRFSRHRRLAPGCLLGVDGLCCLPGPAHLGLEADGFRLRVLIFFQYVHHVQPFPGFLLLIGLIVLFRVILGNLLPVLVLVALLQALIRLFAAACPSGTSVRIGRFIPGYDLPNRQNQEDHRDHRQNDDHNQAHLVILAEVVVLNHQRVVLTGDIRSCGILEVALNRVFIDVHVIAVEVLLSRLVHAVNHAILRIVVHAPGPALHLVAVDVDAGFHESGRQLHRRIRL